jgi:general stress protein YciG
VTVVQDPPAAAEPSQQGGDSRPGSSGKDPERTRSSGARRKSTGSAMTGSARSERGQSPAPRTSDRSRTLDKARSPIRHQTSDPEASRDKGKTHALSTTPTFPADHPMPEPLLTLPSRTTSTWEPRVSSVGRHSELPAGKSPTPSPGIRKSVVSGTPGSRTPRAEETCDLEDEIAPSPNMRRALTRGHAKASPGTSSLVGGLDFDYKERTPKKPRPS